MQLLACLSAHRWSRPVSDRALGGKQGLSSTDAADAEEQVDSGEAEDRLPSQSQLVANHSEPFAQQVALMNHHLLDHSILMQLRLLNLLAMKFEVIKSSLEEQALHI